MLRTQAWPSQYDRYRYEPRCRGQPLGPAAPLALAELEIFQDSFQLVRSDQNVARLGPFRRTNDSAGFQDVHQPPSLGKSNPQLALQHRRRAELQGNHKLRCLHDEIKIITDVFRNSGTRFGSQRHILAVGGLELITYMTDNSPDFLLGDPGTLDTDRLARPHRKEQPV